MKLLGLFLLPSPGLLWPPKLSPSQGLAECWRRFPGAQSPGQLELRGSDGSGEGTVSYSSKFSPSRFSPQTALPFPPPASLFGF